MKNLCLYFCIAVLCLSFSFALENEAEINRAKLSYPSSSSSSSSQSSLDARGYGSDFSNSPYTFAGFSKLMVHLMNQFINFLVMAVAWVCNVILWALHGVFMFIAGFIRNIVNFLSYVSRKSMIFICANAVPLTMIVSFVAVVLLVFADLRRRVFDKIHGLMAYLNGIRRSIGRSISYHLRFIFVPLRLVRAFDYVISLIFDYNRHQSRHFGKRS